MCLPRNSKAPQISPRGQRFKDLEFKQKQFVPGPGAYEVKDYLSGEYVLSKFKNPGTGKFGSSKRMEIKFSKDTPGPGTYRPPSDFGYLDISTKNSPRTS
jgi:hypothetical protein